MTLLARMLCDRFAAKPELRDEIVDFFTKQFVEREPFARALGLTPEGFRPLAEAVVDEALASQFCFVTQAPDKSLTGVLLVRDAAQPELRDLSAICPEAAPIHRILSEVSRPFFEKNPPQLGKTIDTMFILSDSRHENRGLSKQLYMAGFLACLPRGYIETVACMTNPRSQKIFATIGGEEVTRIHARTFFEQHGVKVQGDPGDVVFGRLTLPRALRAMLGWGSRSILRTARRQAAGAMGPSSAYAPMNRFDKSTASDAAE